MNTSRIKFIRTKLGRERVWGLADEYPLLIDERLKGKKELEIYIHESLHHIIPNGSEEFITEAAIRLTNTLWHEGYRKVDNSNSLPLQDGKIH
jgi:hypothetical protein